VAKIANTVRWVFIIDSPASIDLAAGWPRFLRREGNFRGRIIDFSRAATRADIRAGGRIPVC
jgi:hypothetical protein